MPHTVYFKGAGNRAPAPAGAHFSASGRDAFPTQWPPKLAVSGRVASETWAVDPGDPSRGKCG